jgi:hypothetical protein
MARDPTVGYSLWAGVEVTVQTLGSESLRREVEEALQQCDRVLASNPRDVDVRLRKAAILLAPYCGAYYLMIPFQDTLRDPDPTWGIFREWVVLNDRAAEVIELFDAVLEIEPDHLKALWWRAGISAAFEKWAEAVHDFNRMLQLDPDDGQTWSAKGWCLHCQRKYLAALECYDRAFELGASRRVLINKVEALIELGRFYNALEDLEMMPARPQFPHHTFMKGYVLALLGRYGLALEHMNAALGGPFSPDSSKVRLVDSRAERFRPYLAYKTGDTQGAEQELIVLKNGFSRNTMWLLTIRSETFDRRFVKWATDLWKLPCDPAYRELVERIDALPTTGAQGAAAPDPGGTDGH